MFQLSIEKLIFNSTGTAILTIDLAHPTNFAIAHNIRTDIQLSKLVGLRLNYIIYIVWNTHFTLFNGILCLWFCSSFYSCSVYVLIERFEAHWIIKENPHKFNFILNGHKRSILTFTTVFNNRFIHDTHIGTNAVQWLTWTPIHHKNFIKVKCNESSLKINTFAVVSCICLFEFLEKQI